MIDKKTYKKIFKRAEHYYKIDNKRNDLVDNLWKELNPSDHSPVIETGLLEAYMDALSVIYGHDIIDSMHYYFHEAKNMEEPICKVNGKKYNAKNLDEYIEFLLEIDKKQIINMDRKKIQDIIDTYYKDEEDLLVIGKYDDEILMDFAFDVLKDFDLQQSENEDTFKNRITQSKEWQDWVKYQEYCLTDEHENEMYAPWDAQEIDKISKEHLQAFYKFIEDKE